MTNVLLEEGNFSLESDLMALDIIDFDRLNGYWPNPGAAMRTIFSHIKDGRASYSIYQVPDFDSVPSREDFPKWKHTGDHLQLGKRFWNWFLFKFPQYELNLMDSPDFQAIKRTGERSDWIWGDFGRVSASAFAWSQKMMRPGHIWISVMDDGYRHVVITSHIDCTPTFDLDVEG